MTAILPQLDALTLDQRIGQTLCLGWQGDTSAEAQGVGPHARTLIDELHVGSIVLLGRNVSPPANMRAALRELKSRSELPLFIAVDQEGGAVNRFRPPLAPLHEFPGAMALGAITVGPNGNSYPPDAYAGNQAFCQAVELRDLGVDWNFAPVADVNSNPANPIIGVRSFGEDPHAVARLVARTVKGYQHLGRLMACAKHFPGHGDTSVDSHLALPTVTGDLVRLEAIELPPFVAAIREGVGSIMTSHILFRALDENRPATISSAILTGLLRERLGFRGLVITDCLEMDAIGKSIGTPRGAVEALKAGADVALVCHTLETQRATFAAIRAAIGSGELPEERLNEAVGRVFEAKRRFFGLPPDSENAENPWDRDRHHALESEIARKAVTLVRDGGAIPVNPPVVLISAHHSAPRLAEALRRRAVETRSIELDPDFPHLDRLEAGQATAAVCAAGGTVICVTSPPEAFIERRIDPERQSALAAELSKVAGDRLVVICAREPYDLQRFPMVGNIICAFGYRDCSIEALADALTGQFKPTGRLPVTVPGLP